MAIQRQETQA